MLVLCLPFLLPQLPYDNRAAFTGISLVARTAQALCVHPSLPVANIAEFLAYVRTHPGQVNFSSAGIGATSHLAMERALAGLAPVGLALIDGNLLPRGLAVAARAVVGGDARCLSIAAASIVAKVARDAIMVDLAQHFPGYGWERNAGYPTAAHLAALAARGVTPHHRRSFAPVHKLLYQEKTASP